MSEGMPAFNKALEICRLLNGIEFTEEEIEEARTHVRRAETTHGLLWGNIANFGNETRALDLLKFLCSILVMVPSLKAHEQFPVAVVAANLKLAERALNKQKGCKMVGPYTAECSECGTETKIKGIMYLTGFCSECWTKEKLLETKI